jgi:hypothetical protein
MGSAKDSAPDPNRASGSARPLLQDRVRPLPPSVPAGAVVTEHCKQGRELCITLPEQPAARTQIAKIVRLRGPPKDAGLQL